MVEVKFHWTKGLYKEALRYHYRHPWYRRWQLVFLLLGVFFLLGGFYLLSRNDALWIAILEFGLAAYFLGFRRLILPLIALRGFHRRPDAGAECVWKFSDDEINCEYSNLAQSVLKWNVFSGALKTPEGFLLYPHRRQFYYIPRAGFQSESDFESLGNLVKLKICDYAEIT